VDKAPFTSSIGGWLGGSHATSGLLVEGVNSDLIEPGSPTSTLHPPLILWPVGIPAELLPALKIKETNRKYQIKITFLKYWNKLLLLLTKR
jgi:hypothetical protein